MDRYLENIEHKAAVLCDALPYIRDFVNKIIVVEYDCGEWLSGVEEKKMIKDIVLLKSIGVIPIVVHRTQMGVDKFRENKRIAKLLELYDTKAIGICGVDIETIQMMIKNDYIPVITPNDIDNEDTPILPEEAAKEIAVSTGAEKVLFLGKEDGIRDDEGHIISQMTRDEVVKMYVAGKFEGRLLQKVTYALQMIEQGVPRVHILGSKMAHALLVEIFSIIGVGTVIMPDKEHYYPHELKKRAAATK